MKILSVGLEEAEKEMGGKTWSLSELEALLSEDGVLEANDKHCQKIASDENTRFLLVRDITKAMNEATNQAGPSTSKASLTEPSSSKPIENEADEDDLDLQRAIQLSLLNEPEQGEVETNSRIKLNVEQRQKFSSTIQSHGLIRGFMMEYAEMNDGDIKELLESTQAPFSNDVNDSLREKFPNTSGYVLYGTPKKNQTHIDSNENPEASAEQTQLEIAATSDSDLVEISEKKCEISENQSDSTFQATKNVVITVSADLKNFSQEEDLFADIFSTKNKYIPDVEVASISSDDDTLPYEVPPEDLKDIVEIEKLGKAESVAEAIEEIGVSENEMFWSSVETHVSTNSELASQEGKETKLIADSTANVSENEKFWSELEANNDKIDAKIDEGIDNTNEHAIPKLPENEKICSDVGKVIEIHHESDAILKTPEKLSRENSPPPAKVTSPFFVNRKTPNSKKKETLSQPIIHNRAVAKTLFPEPQTSIQLAVNELKNQKTSEELHEMKIQLVDEQKNLLQERNKMSRMGTSITESMSRDCKDLLKLFGIPYIDSPMEAEAQCAFLNFISLTDGTISDDSDIWLFGGQTVYKNFFVQKKIVTEFRQENIDQMFHLSRNKLIQLAMLVGSDYTVGINGIGAVTALEILAAFPTTEAEGGTDEYQSLVSSLRKFREWFQGGKQSGPGGKTVLKSKLKNVELFDGFPNINVARAYLEPTVDTNAEPFTWGMPDSESLVEFAKIKLGWTRFKTEEILSPVFKRLNEKKQSTIKDYFKSQVSKKFFDNQKMSKRVQKAVGKLGGEEESPEPEKIAKKASKRKASSKAKAKVEEENPLDSISLSSDDELAATEKKSLVVEEPESSTSELHIELPAKAKRVTNLKKKKLDDPKPRATQRKRKLKDVNPSSSNADPSATAAATSDLKKKAAKIPNTKQVIPQREKDKEDQEKAKQKAIELFKKTNKNQKK